MIKKAVLSMDVEDWYHLDYFKESQCVKNHNMLDGVDKYCEILEHYDIPSSFFVVGDILKNNRFLINKLKNNKNDIGSHGWSHKRPITLNMKTFQYELEKSKDVLENTFGKSIEGFRAPCFSMDRKRLDEVKAAGYLFDSSRISFNSHPLYETLDVNGFEKINDSIYKLDNFFEFEVTTSKFLKKRIPISGGGYLRIFPWAIFKSLIKPCLKRGNLYILYIHPFELSSKKNPPFPMSSNSLTKLRFGLGRTSVQKKLIRLINLLYEYGYSFTTFSNLRSQLLKNS